MRASCFGEQKIRVVHFRTFLSVEKVLTFLFFHLCFSLSRARIKEIGCPGIMLKKLGNRNLKAISMRLYNP